MFITFGIHIVFVLNIICCVYCDGQLKIDIPCEIAGKNATGTCVPLASCPQAIMQLQRKKSPQKCQTTEETVCCEKPRKPGEMSIQKCSEYGEYAYTWESPPTFGFIKEPPIKISRCVFEAKPLIFGGVNADDKEFPHMALLGYGEKSNIHWDCGGSLISERFVLTAAHCTASKIGILRFVRLGTLFKFSNPGSNVEDFTIEDAQNSIFKFPSYTRKYAYNDIALVKLDRQPKTIGEFIRPACLNTQLEFASRRSIACGWGGTTMTHSDPADHLQKVVLEIFSHEDCKTAFPADERLTNGIIEDKQFCAGGKSEAKDTCGGDSGGPLQTYSKVFCMYDIVGVTSTGKSICGIKKIPGIYSRVSEYIPWIESIVWPQES